MIGVLGLLAGAASAGAPCGSSRNVLERLDEGLCAIDAVDGRGRTVTHAFAHDADTLRALLERGAPVDVPDAKGVTPLGAAARGYGPNDTLEPMRLLVEAGAALDPPDAVAPLCVAGLESARWLLERGASPRPRGCVPLVEAAGNPELLELLAGAGADTTQPALDDALRAATTRGDAAGMRWLLARGADVHQRAADGATLPWVVTRSAAMKADEAAAVLREAGALPGPRPLDRAPYAVAVVRRFGVSAVAEALLSGADLAETDAVGRTAAEILDARGDAYGARWLRGEIGLREPPPVRSPAPPPPPPDPLVLAVKRGDGAKVRALLEAGADPDGLGDDAAPLAAALEPEAWQRLLAGRNIPGPYVEALAPSPSEDLVALLLAHGADPDACAADCPLALAAAAGLPHRVDQLLDAGASAGRGDPLCLAASNGHRAVVERLLARGAPVGRAADCAAAGERTSLLPVLAAAGAPIDGTTLHAAIGPWRQDAPRPDPGPIRWLVEHGVPVDAPDADGRTPLGRAVALGRHDLASTLLALGADPRLHAPDEPPPLGAARWLTPDLLRALLDAGADPASRDRGGRTVLERVITERELTREPAELARLLLAAGVDPDTRAADGRPLLNVVLEDEVASGVALVLLEAGPDLEARSADGLAPLHAAVRGGSADAVAWLLSRGVDPDPRAIDGTTPLMLAVDLGDAATVEHLLEAGARPGRRRDDGLRAVDLACRHAAPEVRARLRCR